MKSILCDTFINKFTFFRGFSSSLCTRFPPFSACTLKLIIPLLQPSLSLTFTILHQPDYYQFFRICGLHSEPSPIFRTYYNLLSTFTQFCGSHYFGRSQFGLVSNWIHRLQLSPLASDVSSKQLY